MFFVCHHLASLVLPNNDPQDGVFYQWHDGFLESTTRQYGTLATWQISTVKTRNNLCISQFGVRVG